MALTLQFIPYNEIQELGSARRVKKLIDIAKQNKIVLLEGRLRKEEEADLISIAMEEINKSFKGIELAVINPEGEKAIMDKIKLGIARAFAGNRYALTIIGPATIVKEIKKDPRKIELMLKK